MPVSPVVHEILRQVLDWNDSRAKTWAATFYFLIGLGMICQTFSLALLEFLVNPPALVTLSAKVSRRSSRHSLLDVPLTHVQFYSHHGGGGMPGWMAIGPRLLRRRCIAYCEACPPLDYHIGFITP